MLSCRRAIFSYKQCSKNSIASLLLTRHNSSSSIDLSTILQHQSQYFEKKTSTTIAYETFIQAPAESVANTLLYMHDQLCLPWWATITIATVAFRVVVGASITIIQQRFIERLQKVQQNVSNKLEPRIKFLNMQAMQGKTATIVEERKHLKREAVQLTKRGYTEHNVHPGKILILAIFNSLPWLYLTFGIRMICMSPMTLPTISQEGFIWIENLAEADPYGILPLGFLIPGLLGITFNSIQKPGSQSPRSISIVRIQRGITRVVIVGFTLIAFKLPAGITLFWTLNSLLQLFQIITFELPRVRNVLGLQPSRFGPNPIQLRWTLWKNKWSLFLRTLKWYSKL